MKRLPSNRAPAVVRDRTKCACSTGSRIARLKRLIYTRRDEIAKLIRRMEAKHWYTDDAVLQNLRSAYHALHAAVQVMCSLDGSPVETKPVGPIYPLPSGRQKRRGWVG